MNKIIMVPISRLEHHPKNPRLDLGDLSELTESIKAQGVLQNLTVVPRAEAPLSDEDIDDICSRVKPSNETYDFYVEEAINKRSRNFYVLIGNRRFEAAKLAGLEAVPCAIVQMDESEQIATMLCENMQRADLTPYEQAQGVQMMMDLGMSVGEIAERTGFSRTTVNRRAELAKMNPDTLKKVGAQLTMDQLDKIIQVEDPKERDELLAEVGGNNFDWRAKSIIKTQKAKKNYKPVRDILLQAGCEEVSRAKQREPDFWRNYQSLYMNRIDLAEYKPGDNILPEDERNIIFYEDSGSVYFYAERLPETKEPDPEEEELRAEQEKAKQEAEEAWKQLMDIEKTAAQRRTEFIARLDLNKSNMKKSLTGLAEAVVLAISDGQDIPYTIYDFLPEQEDEQDDDDYAEKMGQLVRAEMDAGHNFIYQLTYRLFHGDEEDAYFTGRRWSHEKKPEYQRNVRMEACYAWLSDLGYAMSSEEVNMMIGELDCFRDEEEQT